MNGRFAARQVGVMMALVLLACASSILESQALEVQQSSGFVEVLLPDVGWRQAVLGRQLPPDSVITSWLAASARLAYGESVVTVGPLSDVRILSVAKDLVGLSLRAGTVTVESSTPPCEIEFRGLTVRLEQGSVSLTDGMLKVLTGNAVVKGAQDQPLALSAGSEFSLLNQPSGPIFKVIDQ
jgi:hypothetical protein